MEGDAQLDGGPHLASRVGHGRRHAVHGGAVDVAEHDLRNLQRVLLSFGSLQVTATVQDAAQAFHGTVAGTDQLDVERGSLCAYHHRTLLDAVSGWAADPVQQR